MQTSECQSAESECQWLTLLKDSKSWENHSMTKKEKEKETIWWNDWTTFEKESCKYIQKWSSKTRKVIYIVHPSVIIHIKTAQTCQNGAQNCLKSSFFIKKKKITKGDCNSFARPRQNCHNPTLNQTQLNTNKNLNKRCYFFQDQKINIKPFFHLFPY